MSVIIILNLGIMLLGGMIGDGLSEYSIGLTAGWTIIFIGFFRLVKSIYTYVTSERGKCTVIKLSFRKFKSFYNIRSNKYSLKLWYALYETASYEKPICIYFPSIIFDYIPYWVFTICNYNNIDGLERYLDLVKKDIEIASKSADELIIKSIDFKK